MGMTAKGENDLELEPTFLLVHCFTKSVTLRYVCRG